MTDMSKKTIVNEILRISRQSSGMMYGSSGLSWAGQSGVMQPQLNEAIEAWLKDDDPEPLKGIVAMLQTTNVLSDAKADELLRALGAKEK